MKYERACRTCDFWQQGNEGNPLTGLCRLSPPQIVHYSLDVAPLSSRPVWPETTADDWCAHHQTSRPAAQSGDDRPGCETVKIEDNGIITVTHWGGETFELSALDGLSEKDREIIERMAWLPEHAIEPQTS